MSEDAQISPEPWPVHLLGLVNPCIVIAGNMAGGIYTAAGLVFMLGLGPILEIMLGEAKPAPPPRESGRPFEVLLVVHAILHFFVLGSLLWFAVGEGLTVWLLTASVSTGISSGASATITAHELGHRQRGSFPFLLARALLWTTWRSDFTATHNTTHHGYVGTDRDPASELHGRSLYRFVGRTIPAQIADAVSVHNRKGRTGLYNPVIRGIALQLAVLAGLLAIPEGTLGFDGVPVAAAWLGQAAISTQLLESVNYWRHYSLSRGEDEKITPSIAWNSDYRMSRWCLLELSRHSDHHMRASVPFWKLRPIEGAPSLPGGYFVCFWISAIPPLWHRMMRDRLPENSP